MPPGSFDRDIQEKRRNSAEFCDKDRGVPDRDLFSEFLFPVEGMGGGGRPESHQCFDMRKPWILRDAGFIRHNVPPTIVKSAQRTHAQRNSV